MKARSELKLNKTGASFYKLWKEDYPLQFLFYFTHKSYYFLEIIIILLWSVTLSLWAELLSFWFWSLTLVFPCSYSSCWSAPTSQTNNKNDNRNWRNDRFLHFNGSVGSSAGTVCNTFSCFQKWREDTKSYSRSTDAELLMVKTHQYWQEPTVQEQLL